MRLSQHFGRTLREAPAVAATAGDRLILRAGLARLLAPGLWAYLPHGARVLHRLEGIIRRSVETAGAIELCLPASSPEQAAVALAASEIESYRDLPRAVVHRGAGAALTTDIYALHAGERGSAGLYESMLGALLDSFARCGLDVLAIEDGDDPAGGGQAHRFVQAHPGGQDRFVRCAGCGSAASIDAARFVRDEARYGDPAPLAEVATPGCATIASLCAFLGIPPQQTLKVVFYEAMPGPALVMALVRGDLEVSQPRLSAALGGVALAAATEQAITAGGAAAGYASPIGLDVRAGDQTSGVIVIADESLAGMSNFVTGANAPGYHVVNANYPRDFAVTRLADIAAPYEGATCARCGGSLHSEAAIEVGRTARTGARLTGPAGAAYLDAHGQQHPVGLDVLSVKLDRLLAAIVEVHHDDYGIVWPRQVAPYAVHLVALARSPDEAATQAADALYADLQAAGLDVLYDDRLLSPGVMFSDADLIGAPLRVTVSARSLEAGGVEIKWRHEKERAILLREEAAQRIAALVG